MIPNTFAGMRVIESVYLTQASEPVLVQRTWGERLFSRPWRPWSSTKLVSTTIPYRGFYKVGNDTIVIHPQTLRAMMQQLEHTT